MNWPARISEARSVLARHGGNKRATVAALSAAWGQRVSVDALDGALRRWADHAPQPIQNVNAAQEILTERTVAEKTLTGEVSLVCILSDLHIPEHDDAALDCAMAWIAAEQPATIVLNGDIGEWESCSQHGTSPAAPMFRADLEAVGCFLRRLRKAAPNARIVFLEGNHCTRLSRMLVTQAPTLRGSLSIPALLELDALGIEWVPEEKQPLRLGDLRIVHGHQMSRGSGPVYAAAKAVQTYGSPGTTVCVGHTHKRQMFRRPMADGHAEGVLLPCLRTLQAGWLHGEVAGWSHGFAVATQRPGMRTALEVVDIENGSCVWGGNVYSC